MTAKDKVLILLTPDGKGRKKKAAILDELLRTCQPNSMRPVINEALKEKGEREIF